MATLFPGALDVFPNPGANDYQDAPGLELDVLMSNALDAIEALEGKVGVDGSAVAASLTYKIAQLEAWRPINVVKAADEPVLNSVALQDDNELFAALVAGRTYRIEAGILFDAAAAADLKYSFTWPGDATAYHGEVPTWTGADAFAATSVREASDASAPIGAAAVGTNRLLLIKGSIKVVTAGILQFRWAQNTLDAANATRVRAGSYLSLSRLL